MELRTARGACLRLAPTPEVKVPTGFRKGRGPLGVLVMCRLTVDVPPQPPLDLAAPVVRLGEAHALGAWLEGVSTGAVPAVTLPGAPAQRFAAPFLAFDLAAADARAATFRVHLAVPGPGSTVADVHDLLPRRAAMTVPLPVVAQAARTWREEIPPLPEGA